MARPSGPPSRLQGLRNHLRFPMGARRRLRLARVELALMRALAVVKPLRHQLEDQVARKRVRELSAQSRTRKKVTCPNS